jgi:hypothetical protein
VRRGKNAPPLPRSKQRQECHGARSRQKVAPVFFAKERKIRCPRAKSAALLTRPVRRSDAEGVGARNAEAFRNASLSVSVRLLLVSLARRLRLSQSCPGQQGRAGRRRSAENKEREGYAHLPARPARPVITARGAALGLSPVHCSGLGLSGVQARAARSSAARSSARRPTLRRVGTLLPCPVHA